MKLLCLSLVLILSSCTTLKNREYSKEEIAQNTRKINHFFERTFMETVDRYPEFQTYLGIKKDYGSFNDISDKMEKEELERSKKILKELRRFNFHALNYDAQISYRILEDDLLQEIENYQFRHHDYPVNQMFGRHAELPSFMINMHEIKTQKDAKDYISRLNLFKPQFDVLITNLETRKKKKILAPKFVYPKAISDSQNIITGFPFDKKAKDSPLYADFKKKIATIKLNKRESEKLLKDLTSALFTSVRPAYQNLILKLEELEIHAPIEGSAEDLPDGNDYYASRLRKITTTDLSANEIHEIGLNETKRIHEEMKEIVKEVGFKDNLFEFFNYLRTDPKFRYSDSIQGKAKYLADSNATISKMKARLPEMFGILPKAELIVKAVEPYREASAGMAFYQGPSEDGSRPGIYYVNLHDMEAVTKYEQEALAYHEALPGHHMQISISKELENIPKFRKHGGFTAYIEGWGLYAEYLPKEFGFYQDPYSNFGRLAMELWRAARLVVDTGLHKKGWTMEEAIRWLDTNTPSPHNENVRAIQRYIVMPGQATAYKIGMLKILELRRYAQNKLGNKFDMRAFHDQVLKDGALPLNILEEKIQSWVKSF